MKRFIKALAMMLTMTASVQFVSCTRDDDSNNGGSNTPLTPETIAGRKFYTDKIYVPGTWNRRFQRTEVRFASNGKAYFTNYFEYQDHDREDESTEVTAEYTLDYPQITFEYDGKVLFANFESNASFKFEGRQTPYPQFPERISGWEFKTESQTITGPYMGWNFEYHGGEFGVFFGARTAIVDCSKVIAHNLSISVFGALNVNYPDFSIDDGEDSVEGYFIDSNAIVVTRIADYERNDTLTRVY